MDTKNAEKLKSIFPEVFLDEYGGETCLEIECGDGWKEVIKTYLKSIHAFFEEQWAADPDSFPIDQLYITQIKEKYGSLRIYNNFPAALDAFEETAESESERTCEISGLEGKLFSKAGFVKTLNPDYAVKNGFS